MSFERVIETKMDDNFVKLVVPPDRVGVDILTGNDLTELDFAQVCYLHRMLGEVIEFLEKYKPPVPSPFDITDEHPSVKLMTHCSTKDEDDPYICVIGHELSVRKAAQLRDWLTEALEYHEGKIT